MALLKEAMQQLDMQQLIKNREVSCVNDMRVGDAITSDTDFLQYALKKKVKKGHEEAYFQL
jgi:hypothetical protein